MANIHQAETRDRNQNTGRHLSDSRGPNANSQTDEYKTVRIHKNQTGRGGERAIISETSHGESKSSGHRKNDSSGTYPADVRDELVEDRHK